jgi:hypothetical protein
MLLREKALNLSTWLGIEDSKPLMAGLTQYCAQNCIWREWRNGERKNHSKLFRVTTLMLMRWPVLQAST